MCLGASHTEGFYTSLDQTIIISYAMVFLPRTRQYADIPLYTSKQRNILLYSL